MRLPNGYGTVYKLRGKRRNPFIARKNVGYDFENDKWIYQTIGYYPSRKDALQALAEFNQNPYDIDTDKITFANVYDKWSSEHFKTISESCARGFKSAYTKCNDIHSMKFKDIRTAHLEGVLNSDLGQATKQHIKSLFNQLYKYALKHDIVTKDYASLCNAVGKYKREKDINIYTQDEINTLWNNIDVENVDMVLISIYTGMRPNELASIEIDNVKIEDGYIIGGSKTENGIDRVIPIHSKIMPLVSARMNNKSNMLFGECCTYEKYRYVLKKVMKRLNMNHKGHESRHTFISFAKEAGVDEYCLKLIVGHAINDLTERVYTHRQIDQLKCEIEKITC